MKFYTSKEPGKIIYCQLFFLPSLNLKWTRVLVQVYRSQLEAKFLGWRFEWKCTRIVLNICFSVGLVSSWESSRNSGEAVRARSRVENCFNWLVNEGYTLLVSFIFHIMEYWSYPPHDQPSEKRLNFLKWIDTFSTMQFRSMYSFACMKINSLTHYLWTHHSEI